MSRFHNPAWNQQRSFARGEVYKVDFPPEPQKGSEFSKLLKGVHRAVVLMDSVFPRKTVIVVPISSLRGRDGKLRHLIHTDVILEQTKYNALDSSYSGIINHDSFIMTNQIRSISRNYLEEHMGQITDDDMLKLQIQIARIFEMDHLINAMVEDKLYTLLGEDLEDEN